MGLDRIVEILQLEVEKVKFLDLKLN